MANVIIDDTYLTDIANAIRSERGGSNTYTPAQMAAAIDTIRDGNVQKIKWVWTGQQSYANNCSADIGQYLQSAEQIIGMIWSTPGSHDSFFYTRWDGQAAINTLTSTQIYLPINKIQGCYRNSACKGWTNKNTAYYGPVIKTSELLTWDDTLGKYKWRTITSSETLLPQLTTTQSTYINSTSNKSGLSGNWTLLILYY